MNRFPKPQYVQTFKGVRAHKRFFCVLAVLLLLFLGSASVARAQTEDEIGSEDDPIKLFERGQDAHARGELALALEFYEEAIKLRPEFPEAEFQRATALISLNRLPEAEKALRRATELRKTWALPFAVLGDLLLRQKKMTEAEQSLTQALKLEPQNANALIALSDLRIQTKAPRESLLQLLSQLRTATAASEASANLWATRGSIERALGDTQAAIQSFARAIAIDPKNISAHIERAEAFASAGDAASAIESAQAARRIAPSSVYVSTTLARLYLQAGNCAEAARTLDEIDAVTKQPAETASLRSVLTIECASGDKERAALEEALAKDQRNAALLSRLCALYRKDDPQRSLDYCRRALETEPGNADYATSYAAALVQARRFAEAAVLLKRVINSVPDNYVAHANLAIALYQLKRFQEALVEYRWILEAKAETTAAYCFIATAHDNLGEYKEALAAYETFLARADAQKFQLEIEKVNLRLPGLRNQIKLGQGAKKKSE
jgi:tetratricopeptide (TPR) repeat protein